MNKIIKDEPIITRYCDWDYFRENFSAIMDEGYIVWGIYPENTLLEINFGDYDVEVHRIKKVALEEEKERHEWEKYAFNCLNKRYEHKSISQ